MWFALNSRYQVLYRLHRLSLLPPSWCLSDLRFFSCFSILHSFATGQVPFPFHCISFLQYISSVWSSIYCFSNFALLLQLTKYTPRGHSGSCYHISVLSHFIHHLSLSFGILALFQYFHTTSTSTWETRSTKKDNAVPALWRLNACPLLDNHLEFDQNTTTTWTTTRRWTRPAFSSRQILHQNGTTNSSLLQLAPSAPRSLSYRFSTW